MIEVREYTDLHGRSPFQQWFEDLDARAAAKVTVALTRLEQGFFREGLLYCLAAASQLLQDSNCHKDTS